MITSMFVSINLEYESIVAFYLHATVSYPIFTHDGWILFVHVMHFFLSSLIIVAITIIFLKGLFFVVA